MFFRDFFFFNDNPRGFRQCRGCVQVVLSALHLTFCAKKNNNKLNIDPRMSFAEEANDESGD